MYKYRNGKPLSQSFGVSIENELIMHAGIDGILGESWEDERGAIVATGFFTYLLGSPTPGGELSLILSQACPYCAVPKSEAWEAYLSDYKQSVYTRYKMRAPENFDVEQLKNYKTMLPGNLRVREVDRAMHDKRIVTDEELNIRQVYGTFDKFLDRGFGFAVLDGETAAALSSTYIVYDGEAEVDITTKPAYRRQGLATAVCAALILKCLALRLTPSWDAQNPESAHLAEKLGFTLDHSYEPRVIRF